MIWPWILLLPHLCWRAGGHTLVDMPRPWRIFVLNLFPLELLERLLWRGILRYRIVHRIDVHCREGVSRHSLRNGPSLVALGACKMCCVLLVFVDGVGNCSQVGVVDASAQIHAFIVSRLRNHPREPVRRKDAQDKQRNVAHRR